MSATKKELVWLHGKVKSPPFTPEGKHKVGTWLRKLQRGDRLGGPQSKPLPTIGRRCHELRVRDRATSWRVIYRTDPDEIVIVDVHKKKSNKLPKNVIERCKQRLKAYDGK